MTVAAIACAPAIPHPVRLRPVPLNQPPFDDEPAPRLRLVGPSSEPLPFDLPGGYGDDRFGCLPTPRAELPDPRPWAARLVVAALEAVAGRRPVQQLMPWTDDAVYAQLGRTLRSRRDSSGPGMLRSLRLCEPADGVVEICAVIAGTRRTRAVAARMEGTDGRWRCTALELG